MDEIIGLLVEQVAKKARAQQNAKAIARPSRPPAAAAASAAMVPGPAQTTARPAPTTARPAPAAAPRPAPPAASRPVRPPPPPDPFAAVAAAALPAAGNPLLAAFANRNGLLAGIVLGEALAPPLSLRDRDRGVW